MLECPNCKTMNSDTNKFCGECGTKLPEPENYCPNCSKIYKTGEKFCTSCGTKLVNEEDYKFRRSKQYSIIKKRLKNSPINEDILLDRIYDGSNDNDNSLNKLKYLFNNYSCLEIKNMLDESEKEIIVDIVKNSPNRKSIHIRYNKLNEDKYKNTEVSNDVIKVEKELKSCPIPAVFILDRICGEFGKYLSANSYKINFLLDIYDLDELLEIISDTNDNLVDEKLKKSNRLVKRRK